MQATISNPPLNATQLHLLKMFSFNKREEGLEELQSVLTTYYKNKLKMQTDKYWQDNNMNSAKMEEIMYGHNRIPVK
jgi:hypothetical protein